MRTESTDNVIKKVGDQPSPATQLKPVDNVPSKTVVKGVDVKRKNFDLLPTHIDNREVLIGTTIELKLDSAIDRKAAIRLALTNITIDPHFYSKKIMNGKIKYPDALRLFTKLFKRDATFLIPPDNMVTTHNF